METYNYDKALKIFEEMEIIIAVLEGDEKYDNILKVKDDLDLKLDIIDNYQKILHELLLEAEEFEEYEVCKLIVDYRNLLNEIEASLVSS